MGGYSKYQSATCLHLPTTWSCSWKFLGNVESDVLETDSPALDSSNIDFFIVKDKQISI